MSEFVVCVLSRTVGRTTPPRTAYVDCRATAASVAWCGEREFRWAINGSHPVRTVRVHQSGRLTAVGDVRLDNHREIASCLDVAASSNDLQLAAMYIDRFGIPEARRLLGDFALVVWDELDQRLTVVRDAIGVKPLYTTTGEGYVAVASRASLLSANRGYDMEFIAEYLLHDQGWAGRTIYNGVSSLAPGTAAQYHDGTWRTTRYWNRADYAPATHADAGECADQLKELLTQSVALRSTGDTTTWSHLSGGLDSSSIVSIANTSATLGGTVTIVDNVGVRDEEAYVDAVLDQYPCRNERIADWWAWQEVCGGQPRTDQPDFAYPNASLLDRLCSTVRDAGGRVLLSGLGADHYLKGNMLFLADLAGTGRIWSAIRETIHWAIASRRSIWRFGFRNAIFPHLPARTRIAMSPSHRCVPSWIDRRFAAAFDLRSRLSVVRKYSAPRGHKFAGNILYNLEVLPDQLDRGVCQERIEMRYPFLFRPLVEFGLRLPPALRHKPHYQKWILRQAMRNILPEKVRTRTAKATMGAHFIWSLSREARRVTTMLRDPILAQLGCVDAAVLRQLYADTCVGRTRRSIALAGVLSLETWLRVESGQWMTLQDLTFPKSEALPCVKLMNSRA